MFDLFVVFLALPFFFHFTVIIIFLTLLTLFFLTPFPVFLIGAALFCFLFLSVLKFSILLLKVIFPILVV